MRQLTVITGPCTFLYGSFLRPFRSKYGKLRYFVEIAVPKNDTTTIDNINGVLNVAMHLKKAGYPRPRDFSAFVDGEIAINHQDLGYREAIADLYKRSYILRAESGSDFPPCVTDAEGNDIKPLDSYDEVPEEKIPQDPRFIKGMPCRVSITASAYNRVLVDTKTGEITKSDDIILKFNLNHIQFIRGEVIPIASRTPIIIPNGLSTDRGYSLVDLVAAPPPPSTIVLEEGSVLKQEEKHVSTKEEKKAPWLTK